MVRHFLTWIPHKRPLSAPVSRDTSSIAERAFAPQAHVTRQLGLKNKINRKDVIWLVGSHKALRRPEVALDGRIVVENKDERREAGTLVFKAGIGSEWFPWRDATELVWGSKLSSAVGSKALNRPQQLRFTRELCATSIPAFEQFAVNIQAARSVFISYRWCNSTDIVPQLMPLLARDFGIWWDRWSGPRRLENEVAPDADLAQMLGMAIERADTAIIVRSPGYETAPWTAYEYSQIMRRERPRFEIEDAEIREAIACGKIAHLVDCIKVHFAVPPEKGVFRPGSINGC